MGDSDGAEERRGRQSGAESVERGAPADRRGEWDVETDDSVSAVESTAQLLSRFEHQGCPCELGVTDDTLYGFVQLPDGVDELDLLWQLDPPGAFSYGPDEAGWVGFDAPTGTASPREVGVALAGLAVQVAERGRVTPE